MWGEPGHDDKFAARAVKNWCQMLRSHSDFVRNVDREQHKQRDNRGRLLHRTATVLPAQCSNAHFELQKTSRTTPNLTR